MEKTFFDLVNQTTENTSITENGALGYKTTKHEILDFLFALSSYRGEEVDASKLIAELDPHLLRFLFYIRDVRNGLGERDTFRQALHQFLVKKGSTSKTFTKMICSAIVKYGRCDDLMCLFDTPLEKGMLDFVKATLKSDMELMKAKKSVSLLAKWMPSINASNKETIDNAYKFAKALKLKPSKYRKMLSKLRKYLDVVEVKACANKWDKIDYNTVPSKANIKYSNAFIKHDEERRREFLNKLAHGDKDVKINGSVNFPHDVLKMYGDCRCGAYDEAVEQLWKNLKELPGLKNTIVVRDDSGSMTWGECKPLPLTIATALSIYCAQHNSSAYKNKLISFSEHPKYLDFSKKGSLNSIYKYLLEHSECANTNIKAVFDLILNTAVQNHVDAKDMPKQILIISDMEFDGCANNVPLFSEIEKEYKGYGYELPKLVFWNVCGRTNTIPMTYNKKGVLLVSGFSQNIMNMIANGETNPYKALIKELDRYDDIPLILE